MKRRISTVSGIAVTAVLASMLFGAAAFGQRAGAAPGGAAQAGGPGGGPGGGAPAGPEVITETKPVPIKVAKRDYDKKQLLAAPVLSEEAQVGRAIWLQKCAYCHDGVGQPTYKTMGGWLGAETITLRGEPAVRAFINNGTVRMPGFQYNLDATQLNSLITFMKTISSDTKPTPAQLAGRAAGPGNND